ncbi:hypothetical protein B0H11DRAFT_2259668 [Mycena galericulata]|nr:hypothetical protein B0H11DRAFT_2259668 [Mycena galericulata]
MPELNSSLADHYTAPLAPFDTAGPDGLKLETAPLQYQNAPHGGQTFASTLLLSFACTPMLKQYLLRNLQMTNEELASLEPIIAEAWDRWNQGRWMEHPEGFPRPRYRSLPPASRAPATTSVAASSA